MKNVLALSIAVLVAGSSISVQANALTPEMTKTLAPETLPVKPPGLEVAV